MDLDDPEAVKEFIANKRCANSYKNEFVKAYDHYVKFNGLTWEKPRHKWERKIPRIPTKEAIKKVIARASQKVCYRFHVAFGEDKFTSAVARNLQEACKLIEAGFEYVTDMEGAKLFRKRK